MDSAIVSAVKLSHRYIADRCLPDKAIDLLDEAASALRIEIDTMPEEIDVFIREKIQLEMNKKALEKDNTAEASKKLDKNKFISISSLEIKSSSLILDSLLLNGKNSFLNFVFNSRLSSTIRVSSSRLLFKNSN